MSMHPAETYAQRLREYQWESLMLYRARTEGRSAACVQGGIIGVKVALERLWHAQCALYKHAIDRAPPDMVVHAALLHIRRSSSDVAALYQPGRPQ